MDAGRIAEERIVEAQQRGDLTPTVGVGEPLSELNNDPDWWVRALLERERLPERRAELEAWIGDQLDLACSVADLDEARTVLARVNGRIDRWNVDVPDPDRFTTRSEVWLLGERAKRRR